MARLLLMEMRMKFEYAIAAILLIIGTAIAEKVPPANERNEIAAAQDTGVDLADAASGTGLILVNDQQITRTAQHSAKHAARHSAKQARRNATKPGRHRKHRHGV